MPTHVAFKRNAQFANDNDSGTWEVPFDFQMVLLFCLLGLMGELTLASQFPNLGVLIAEYNQF